MLKILQARLQQNVNCKHSDVQAGFRKGRGTRDQIANIYWIICLENPMDRGAWKAAVHGVAKSRTRLSDFHFHFIWLLPVLVAALKSLVTTSELLVETCGI